MKAKPAQNPDAKRVAAALRKSLLRQAKKHTVPEAPFLPTGYEETAQGFRLKFPNASPAPSPSASPADLRTQRHTACSAIDDLERRAASGNRDAAERLAEVAAYAANALERLARTKPAAVRTVAPRFPWWPVLLSPHKENQTEALALLDDLKVATAAPERMRGRWRNAEAPEQLFRHVVARYVVWMAQTLRHVHVNMALREAIRRDPAAWPEWIAEAVALKPLTQATAPAWFAVGWKMLLACTDGDPATIDALDPVGDSNADYWARYRFSPTVQASQRRGGIQAALRRAFLERFGN